jgi:hypothetical protein
VALIRDPGLDREQTSKNVSPTIYTYERERQVVKDRERQVVKDQEGAAGGKERGLRGTKAGSLKPGGRPALSIYLVRTLRRRSKFRISLKYHAPQRVPPDASQARLRYPMPSLTVM